MAGEPKTFYALEHPKRFYRNSLVHEMKAYAMYSCCGLQMDKPGADTRDAVTCLACISGVYPAGVGGYVDVFKGRRRRLPDAKRR